MPIWCNNDVVIEFPSIKERDRFILNSNKELTKNGKKDVGFSFDALIPMPNEFKEMHIGSNIINGKKYSHWKTKNGKDVGVSDVVLYQLKDMYGVTNWREWTLNNWGTKWDVHGNAHMGVDKQYINISFETAWSPPIQVYEHIYKNYKCDIKANYDEPGMGYYGMWINGHEESYEYTQDEE